MMKTLFLAAGIAIIGSVLSVAPARSQTKDVELLKKEVASLQADLKALKAEIAKLKGEDGKLVPTISEYEKKWARNLVADFMREMLKGPSIDFRESTKKFVATGMTSHHDQSKDPNVRVSQKDYGGKDKYAGPRLVNIDWVFDKYQIDLIEVAPNKEELRVQGKLTGNNEKLVYAENWASDRRGTSTEITEGKLGERTGTFTLRVTREPQTKRWTISYFAFSVDKLKNDGEK